MDEQSEIREINETIAQRYANIEAGIASSQDLRELFEKLLLHTEEEFEIPYIWFSFINNRENDALIKQLESSELLKDRLNSIEASAFESLIKNDTKPLLANNDLKPFFKLLPKSNKFFLKSLAVAPVTLNGMVIGSLNYGDSDGSRYSPDMDTTLLCGLAEKFSSTLSNILTGINPNLPVDEKKSEI